MGAAGATERGQSWEHEEGAKEQDFPPWQLQTIDQLSYNMKSRPAAAYPKGMPSRCAF